MKLDKEQLLELQDYIDILDQQIGLDTDTVIDINKAISRELDKIKKQENLIAHFDNMDNEK